MDIYRIINESKSDKNHFTKEEIDELYKPFVEKALMAIIVNGDKSEEKNDYYNIANIILKNKNNYWEAVYNKKEDDFYDDINKEITNEIIDNKLDKKDLFDSLKKYTQSAIEFAEKAENNPDSIIFALFIKEYETKTSFTWKMFKNVKRDYEKNNPLEGENIYNLKRIIEKDPNIDKVLNDTVFSKHAHTLTNKTIDKIKEKAK